MTLGSLFDGIGGFPLAGAMCGIDAIWSSEIEPFPLKVTAARFPNMKQFGSVTDIDGGMVEPVDIITFGSPCQDLSVAGKQLGIHEGQRSNLFFEAVRIIKEMRKADERTGRTGKHIRPRFAVWENVPGAFSSNGGEDFKAVLEALAGVMQDGLDIPRPKKWNHAGGVAGDGWSIAWRVYDAQYWGVPQRRKRIYLVADFASEHAPEILFERESVRGDSAACGEAREGITAHAEGSAGGSGGVRCLNPWGTQTIRQYDVNGVSPCISANNHGGQNRWGVCYALQGNGIDRSDTAGCNVCGWREGEMYTLNTIDRPAVVFQQNQREEVRDLGEQAGALTAQPGIHNQNFLCYQRSIIAATCGSFIQTSADVGLTLMARDYKDPQIVCVDSQENSDALAFQLSGDRANPSVSVSDTAYCIPANPMSDRGQSVVYDARGNGNGDTAPTLTGDHERRVTDYTAVCVGNGQLHHTDLGDKTGALNCMHDQQAVVYPGVGITSPQNGNNPQPGDPAPSLTNDSRNYLVQEAKPPRKYIVRRLTPTECARLQGFPDEWCEGLGGSDSAIYKAYGNGLALPCAYDVLHRISEFVKRDES